MMRVKTVWMKATWARLLLLMALPGLLLAFHAYFTRTVDDSRFLINTDPDYAYLLSAIDLSRLGKSRMVMHPGTPVQWLSHLLMKARYWLCASKADDFATSVLKNSGAYLNLLHHAFSLMNIALLWLFGFLAYQITRRMGFALLFQSLPFLFAPIAISGFRKVSSDIILVSASLLLAGMLLKTVHAQQAHGPSSKRLALAIVFGLVVGFGMATKITFSIMAIIPLVVIPSLLGKAAFILMTSAVFWLLTLPISPAIHFFNSFLLKIMTHRGIYGHGPVSLFNLRDFFTNMFSLCRENFTFILFILFSVAIIGFSITASASRERKIQIWKEPHFRALAAVTLVQVVGVLMVARHFKSKYLIPAFALTAAGIYLLNRHMEWLKHQQLALGTLWKKAILWRAKLLGTFIVLSLLNSALSIGVYHRQRLERRSEARMIEKKLQGEFRGFAVVYFYNAASLVYGLAFGNEWTPLYARPLERLFGEQYFYNPGNGAIHGWSRKNRITLETLKEKTDNRIVFYGMPFPVLSAKTNGRVPDLPLRDVAGGKGITLYQLDH